MGKRVLSLCVVLAMVMGFACFASAADEPKSLLPYGLSGSLGFDANWGYFDPLSNSKITDRPVFQPYLILKHKSGFYGGGNASFGIDNNFDKANDYTWFLGYEKANIYKGIGLDLRVSYRDLPPTFHKNADFWGPRLELNRPFKFGKQTVTPYVAYEFLFSTKSGSSSDNGIATAGARYNWKSGRWSVDMNAAYSHDWGVYGQTAADFGRVDGSLNYYIGKNVTWHIVKAGAVIPISSQPKAEQRSDVDGWVGTGFSFAF